MKISPALILVAVALAAIAFLVIKRMSLKNSRTTGEWPPEVVAKVEKDRAAREAVRQQGPQLFAAVSAAMFRHDPIGINFNTNTDEYEAEAGTVIPRLRGCSSPGDVATVLHEEFSKWFGSDTAGPKTRYTALADEIWTLWSTHKTEPGGAANVSQPIRSETNGTSSAAGSRR
jgi:hypothetical protein